MKPANRKAVAGLIVLLGLGWSAIAQVSPPDALARYRSGDFAEAVRICLIELESTPRNMNSYSVLGWSLIALGRYDEALEQGMRAVQIAPNDPRILEIVAEAHYFLGNDLDALGYFERYAVLSPTGDRIDRVYFLMGEVFIRLGEYNHADVALSTAVYHSPNVSAWWARLGYAREMSEDYVFSIQAYDQALALNPSLADAARGKDRVQTLLDRQ